MKRASFFVVFLLLANFFLPFSTAQAADCSQPQKLFSSNYNVVFQVESDLSATVTQNVSLKNLTGDCFVSEYSLAINSEKVVSASGKDSIGNLPVELKKTTGSTVISTRLNEEVAGLGKTADFSLQYKIADFATKQGTVWNLVVPKVVASEAIEDYNLKLIVPKSLGPVFSVSPKPTSLTEDETFTSLSFGKELLSQLGVFASFGQVQEITFSSKLLLQSKNIFSQKFLIPLPPDTEKQKTILKSLEPSPSKITLDSMGNYFATYSVSFAQSLEVTVNGIVKIGGEKSLFSPAKVYSQAQLKSLQKESSKIPVENKNVQEKAKSLKTLEQIYAFVTSHLTYDKAAHELTKAKRRGAENLLTETKPATSLDFVDLFTAIARAAGYPTRQVVGIAISTNQSSHPTFVGEPLNTKNLHAWAQVWDESKKAWLDVDPTWGATSGSDYLRKELPDRIALLLTESVSNLNNLKIYALSSKNLKVGFSPEPTTISPKVDLLLDTDQAVAGLPAQLKVKIVNSAGIGMAKSRIEFSSPDLQIVGEKVLDLGTLLPYEARTVSFKLRGGGLLSSSQGEVKVKFVSEDLSAGLTKETTKQVKIDALFSLGVQQVLLLSILLLLVGGVGFQWHRNKTTK